MGSNKNPRQITDGKLRCGSKHHDGDRMVPVEDFPTKARTPDGYDYACRACHSKYNKRQGKHTYNRWKGDHPERALLVGRRADAKKRGIEFTIEEKDVIIPMLCPVLGIPIIHNTGNGEGRSDNSPSLDRIHNDRGYIPGNVVVISWRANMLKKDASIAELIRMADFYKQFLGENNE